MPQVQIVDKDIEVPVPQPGRTPSGLCGGAK